MATIKDISQKCGVSPATVSKALNGYTDISQETVELVRRIAKEMHYTPNAAARLLKTNISHNIGVVFMDESACGLTHEYFSRILNSVKEEAEQNGYDITFISNTVGKKPMSFLQHCLYRNCDGVVIASVNFDNPAVHELVNSNVPVVTIDFAFDNISSVMSDNVEGAYNLTSYILDIILLKVVVVMPVNRNELTKEMVIKALQCKDADELIVLAKTGGIELTKE